MNKQAIRSANQTHVDSASPSATNTVATSTQPPQAPLLGLPKELLNFIIALAVVEDPDPDPQPFLIEQREETDVGTRGMISAFYTPALARTCTELEAIVMPIYYGQHLFVFCSLRIAYDWLSRKRIGRSEAYVRRVRLHFPVFQLPYETPAWTQAVLEMFLKDKTNTLAVSESCSFYVGACGGCQRKLRDDIQQINYRVMDYEFGERLAALASYFSSRGWVTGFPEGCVSCGTIRLKY